MCLENHDTCEVEITGLIRSENLEKIRLLLDCEKNYTDKGEGIVKIKCIDNPYQPSEDECFPHYMRIMVTFRSFRSPCYSDFKGKMPLDLINEVIKYFIE